MTKTIGASLQSHINTKMTTLATCWKITRTDAVTIGLTDHQEDIVYSGVTYNRESGFTASAMRIEGTMASDTVDLEALLAGTGFNINEADIRAGVWDYAEVWMFFINYQDTSQGIIKLRRGRFGEVKIQQGKYLVQIIGLTDYYQRKIGDLYSPECRVDLFSSDCSLESSDYRSTGQVTGISSGKRIFSDTGDRTETTDYWNYGYVQWLSGSNNGLKMEVKDFSGVSKNISLFLPMPYTISSGNKYYIFRGCDKKWATCKNTAIGGFNNSTNFRGEPFMPGPDAVGAYPDSPLSEE